MSEKPSIEAIFSEAVETDSADLRQAFLDAACGAEPNSVREWNVSCSHDDAAAAFSTHPAMA